MCEHEQPSRRALFLAAAMGAAIALLGLAARARGATSSSAHCRIHNRLPAGVANVGSGTLVDVTADRRRGLVLTCAHLFAEGCGRVVVEFPGGGTHGGSLIGIDRQADLAAVEIAGPAGDAAPIAFDVDASAPLTACGFGPAGQFRSIVGPVVGAADGPGQSSLKIAGAVRSGDSGGGVFDARGRLVAVVWGEREGVTYATAGGPLRRFVQRFLGSRAPTSAAPPLCPDGNCPLVAQPPIAGAGPSAGPPGCPCGDALAVIAGRLDALGQAAADGEQRHASLLARLEGLSPLVGAASRAAAPVALSALGISGPFGWGVLAAIGVGGWLVGRRINARGARRTARADASHQPEATADADASFRRSRLSVETRQPIERDDREARQLLRLSQLEGRDPLQDALAGRLALDRLDAAAEGDADPQRSRWADELRRELRDRFNDVAPTKFQVKA